jgi:hypothetical protein
VRFVLCIALIGVGACSDRPGKRPCPEGFLGDPTLPPQAVMVYTDGASQGLSEVHAGQPIPLEPPPQGGYVMYLAARILNLDACVEFSASLTDPATGNQIGFDARSSTVQRRDDGWGWPDPTANSNVSNVNGCPDYFSKDVQGRTFTLEMTVADEGGRTAKVSQPIIPTCMLSDAAAQANCLCTCSANYVLGKCETPVDGGTRD